MEQREIKLAELVKKTDVKFQRLLKKHPTWNGQYMNAYHKLMDWYEKEEAKIKAQFAPPQYRPAYNDGWGRCTTCGLATMHSSECKKKRLITY